MKLEQLLKKPTSLNIKFPDEVEEKIKHWEKLGLFYGIFPIVGNSMTSEDERNIPDGSKVLAVQLDISNKFNFPNKIPLRKPLLIKLTDDRGENYCVCKTITQMDFVFYNYRLSSYNPAFKDAWIPIKSVDNILEIHHVF